MKNTWINRAATGVLGGLTFAVVNYLTFGLFSGSRAGETGLLFDPSSQSAKVIAVWKDIQPLPWLVTQPWIIAIGLVFFGIIYAGVYASVEKAWPPGMVARVGRLTALTFVAPIFFEMMGPFNLLHEPTHLQLIEFAFWLMACAAQSLVIVALHDRKPTLRRETIRISIGL
jgi:hypothetical protein